MRFWVAFLFGWFVFFLSFFFLNSFGSYLKGLSSEQVNTVKEKYASKLTCMGTYAYYYTSVIGSSSRLKNQGPEC